MNNTLGVQNVFVGQQSGSSNTTENSNTFSGFKANGTSGIHNATAIGSNSVVASSDAVVLGSLTDFNGQPTEVFVGIGTPSPLTKLNVVENNQFRVIRAESSHNTGTWLELKNSSTGGHTWAILSAGTNNGESAGNLVLSDETGGGKVVLNNTLQVPNCSGCTSVPSDRNLKFNFAAVNGRSVLDRLAVMPIQSWTYKNDPPNLLHMVQWRRISTPPLDWAAMTNTSI